MSAVESGTSGSPIGQTTQSGVAAFATTHWSVVLTAQNQSPEAEAALERLCRIYWWPLYGFVRQRQGYGPEEAQDLVQGFFALLLKRRDLNAVRKEKGRLRSYLLVWLKNFLGKARRRELALKHGEGRPLVPLDELLARERAGLGPGGHVHRGQSLRASLGADFAGASARAARRGISSGPVTNCCSDA